RRSTPSRFLSPFSYSPPPHTPTLSLHDALPIFEPYPDEILGVEDGYASPESRYDMRESVELAFIAALQHLPPNQRAVHASSTLRSEEHTSELQSPYDLVCRLLLEKKKTTPE